MNRTVRLLIDVALCMAFAVVFAFAAAVAGVMLLTQCGCVEGAVQVAPVKVDKGIEAPTSQPYMNLNVDVDVPDIVIPERMIDAHTTIGLNGKTPWILGGAAVLVAVLLCTQPVWRWFKSGS